MRLGERCEIVPQTSQGHSESKSKYQLCSKQAWKTVFSVLLRPGLQPRHLVLVLTQEMAGIVCPGLYAKAEGEGKRGKGSGTQLCFARMAYHHKQGQRQQQQQKPAAVPGISKAKVMASH